MNERYSERWDKELNKMIDQDNMVINYFINSEFYSVNFGDIKVWVSNYPYGYGSPHDNTKIPNNIRPSRETIERLKKYVDSKQNIEKY